MIFEIMKHLRQVSFVSLFSLFLFFLASCTSSSTPPTSTSSVLVSVAPYAYFVQKISRSTIEPKLLIPLGANPHFFELTPKQVEPLRHVDIWLGIGEPIEQRVLPLIKQYNPSLTFVDLSTGIELLSLEECHVHAGEKLCAEATDRHFWLSPALAITQAKMIAAALSQRYPEQKELFALGLQELLRDLEALDKEAQQILSPLQGTAIITSHPAFGYFCREFGLTQLSVEYEGKDPMPRQVQELLEKAKASSVCCVLLQAQYNNKGALLIAEHLHLRTYSIDPYSINYLENVKHLIEFIAHG